MTSFDNREQAFEAKFAHDEELRFKVFARRDKLFGLWIAEKLGKTGPAAEDYAKSVVVADLEEAGDEDVIRKVSADLSAAGITLSKDEIVKTLAQFLQQAAEQFKN
jgi:hypothetical protein